jgi:serine/threonine protein kinase
VLGRQVALKVPRPEVLVTPDFKWRFLREAEAASRLDHPHIVPVYEVGEEGPVCYIASAYCEGLTLAQWLRLQSASVPVRVACRLVAVLASAVAHAHERGILHRDLKPGNILLQQRDGRQAPRTVLSAMAFATATHPTECPRTKCSRSRGYVRSSPAKINTPRHQSQARAVRAHSRTPQSPSPLSSPCVPWT